jgi:hypothetical protein
MLEVYVKKIGLSLLRIESGWNTHKGCKTSVRKFEAIIPVILMEEEDFLMYH